MNKLIIVGILAVLLVLAIGCSILPPGTTPTPAAPAPIATQTNAPPPPAAPTATERPAPTAIPPTPVPPAATSAPSTAGCKDGSHPQPAIYDAARVPAGTKEGPVVAEVSWKPGNGFGGIDRVIIVIQKWDDRVAINLLNVYTAYYTQYCGDWNAVKAYAKTHIAAMVQSAADSSGNKPDPQEIGVYALTSLSSNTLEVVQPAPKGPSVSTVQSHLEVVR